MAFAVLALAMGLPGASLAEPPRFIAHAGGGIDGRTYTNTREALDAAAANGFRMLEVDFRFTRDGHLVLVHEWSDFTRLFEIEDSESPPSLAAFQAARPRAGLTQMTLADLGRWLTEHPGVDIVTDFKEAERRGVEAVARALPELRDRFVVQLYDLTDPSWVEKLGFERRLLTLYRPRMATSAVKRWLDAHEVYAVATPLRRTDGRLLRKLEEAGVVVYVHTVNDAEELRKLRDRGIHGVYTDWLAPTRASEPTEASEAK